MKLLRLLTIPLFCFSFLLTAPGSVMAGDPSGIYQAGMNAQGHPAFTLNGKAAFEENKGQVTGADAGLVRYRLRTGDLTIFLMETGIAYQFEKITVRDPYQGDAKPGSLKNKRSAADAPAKADIETYRMDLQLVDANKRAQIIAEGRSAGFVNYYNHNALQVYSYDKITYKDIYPGIDWVVFTTTDATAGGRQGLKYEFVVHPGADPSKIQLKTRWAERSLVDKEGNLVLKNRMGEIREKTPVSFQRSRSVGTAFLLSNDLVRFKLDAYDPAERLIIDPALGWVTYYGGSSFDGCYSTRVDAAGNIYIAGRTSSTGAIASGGHQSTSGGANDAFLVKFNSDGVRQWATYYGGTGDDGGTGCCVDASGNVYLSGWTTSSSGIAFNGVQNFFEGDYDAFLVKFNSDGVRQWATYIGGSSTDQALACVNDASGNVYLCGNTSSTYNIASDGFKNTISGTSDAFLVKFDTNGARLWGTYYGGSSDEAGSGCRVDASGNVFLLGSTASSSGIASGGFQNSISGSIDGYLVKFNANGSRLWATYIGGNNEDYANDFQFDNSNNIYVCGETNSTTGLASGGHQMTFEDGISDAFLVKYDPDGTRLWATYYGGSGFDAGNTCLTDASGNVYLVGESYSTDNIASNGFQNNLRGGSDAFLVQFNPSGVRQWASYAGGNDFDFGNSCARDHLGNIYIAGSTTSTDLASGGHQNTYGGGTYDAFIMKIVACAPFVITADPLIQTACSGKSIDPVTPASSEPTAVFSWTRDHTAEATGIPASGSGSISGTLTNTTGAPVTVTFTITATTDDCSSLPLTVQVTVYPDLSADLKVDITDPACFGREGEIALSSQSGNEAYTYAWNTGQTTASVQAGAGAYTVTVTPGNGCSFVRTFTLTQPDEIQVSVTNNNGTLSASATGGTGELTYAWSTGETTPAITVMQLGDYTVTVTDENGCEQTATVTVTTLATGGLSVPEWKVFPNPTTGLVKIGTDKTEKQILIQIADISGMTRSIDVTRDGAAYLLNMTALPPGVYIISLKSSDHVWSKRVIKM